MEIAVTIISVIILVASVSVSIYSFVKYKQLRVKNLIKKQQEMENEAQKSITEVKEVLKKAGYSDDDIEKKRVMCIHCGKKIDRHTFICPYCKKEQK